MVTNYTKPLKDKEFDKFDQYNNVQIAIQDQYSDIVDLHLSILIAPCTITAQTTLNDRVISIDCATVPVVGNMLCLKESHHFYQADILSVTPTGGTGYDVTVDTPLDFAFTIAGGCSIRRSNLNVNGSVTPVIATISPKGLTKNWDINRIILTMTDATAMDDGKFGGMTKLTNGIVFRKVDGDWKNIFNVKTNSDFAAHAYDLSYSDKAPSGVFGLRVRRSFNGFDKNGVTIRLNADADDEFQLIIQDNLTGLLSFQVIAQGHVVD